MSTQAHYRFRTDNGAADATPTWGAAEDTDGFNPDSANFRIRVSVSNPSATATGNIPYELFSSKNGGSYALVSTSSTGGVKSVDAGSSSDNTSIFIPRLTTPASTIPDWWLTGAYIDLDFANNRVYSTGVFSDYLACSRASIGYARTLSNSLTQFSTDTLRITDSGLLSEDARTNVVLWNRDLTNAAWTPTNITALKDQTGADGAANSASSLEATASNGTILQSITEASSARFQSAWVKRIAGTGSIYMTMDNGATWTVITLSSSWAEQTIPTQTLANPTVGFKITTSGDKIAVDFVQNENGSFGTSPILTTTTSAARAADSITAIGDLKTNLTATAGSAYMDLTTITSMVTYSTAFIYANLWGDTLFQASSNNAQVTASGGGNILNCNFGSGAYTTGAKLAHGFDASGRSLVANNSTVVSDIYPWRNTDSPFIFIGSEGGANRSNSYIRRLTVWNSRLVDATLKSLTA